MKKYQLFLSVFFCLFLWQIDTVPQVFASAPDTAEINVEEKVDLFVFVREGCSVCKKQEAFLAKNDTIKEEFNVQLLDIDESDNRELWEQLVEKHRLSKVTPITLVGGDVLVGFNEDTTGKKILAHASGSVSYDLESYLNGTNVSMADANATCQVDSASSCSLDGANSARHESADEMMDLPFFGEVNVKETSLFVMSAILGFIDGFNPCAMWVLLTFLIILSQIGDKKKMIYLAGIFILAEAIMYFFILNVWYQTWDFIKLDQFVTPLIGLLAIGGGVYFLYKWHKSKGQLTCDVTSFEHQQKTTAKIKDVVSRPMTIVTIFSVLAIAFSVNIIEFACSVGIAQAFTKILEINDLSFVMRQFYIFVYTFFYMMDDFLIFGLAIFGYAKFQTVGAKYSHLSSLIGGILMIILGALLLFKPEWLMFG